MWELLYKTEKDKWKHLAYELRSDDRLSSAPRVDPQGDDRLLWLTLHMLWLRRGYAQENGSRSDVTSNKEEEDDEDADSQACDELLDELLEEEHEEDDHQDDNSPVLPAKHSTEQQIIEQPNKHVTVHPTEQPITPVTFSPNPNFLAPFRHYQPMVSNLHSSLYFYLIIS
jgi:hypothetical protein